MTCKRAKHTPTQDPPQKHRCCTCDFQTTARAWRQRTLILPEDLDAYRTFAGLFIEHERAYLRARDAGGKNAYLHHVNQFNDIYRRATFALPWTTNVFLVPFSTAERTEIWNEQNPANPLP